MTIPTFRTLSTLLTPCVLLCACVEPFRTPSAYEEQRDLCDPQYEGAFAERLAACRQARKAGQPCGGVFSFTGALEGQPLTVESLLTEGLFRIVARPKMTMLLDSVEVTGASPYFAFTVTLGSVGGRADQTSTELRILVLDPAVVKSKTPLQDGLFSMSIELQAGGGDRTFVGLAGTGQLDISFQSPDEIAARFTGSFGAPSDGIAGCFHILATETRKIQEGG